MQSNAHLKGTGRGNKLEKTEALFKSSKKCTFKERFGKIEQVKIAREQEGGDEGKTPFP